MQLFPEIAEPPRQRRFLAEALRVLHVGECAVVRGDARFGRRHAHCEQHGVHRRAVAAIDALRLEQVEVAELQPGHARMRAGDLRRTAQAAPASRC